MALQVWLPLNGTLENKGLSNVTFTNVNTANTTVNNDGKIGKCYANNSHTAGGLISNTTINLGSSQSMFCWFKFTSLESSSSLGGAMVGLHRYSKNQGMGLTLRYVSSTTGYLSINTGNGSSRTYNTYCNTTLLQANTWYHGGYTYDGSQVKIYLNGVCENTITISNMLTPSDYLIVYSWSLSGNSGNTIHSDYKLNGSLNDVRIYNHALSPKEVKEISKGLILHYKLDGNDIGITIPRNGGLIPDGVELYDYILSSGTLWINTGFIPNNNTKVILDFKQNAVTDGFFFGGRDAYGGSACFALHKNFAQFGSDMGSGYSVGDSLNRCTVTLSLNGIYIDNTLKHSYSSMSFTSPKTLKLFGCELSSGMYSNKASMTAYSFKVYNSNTLVRNLIPCTYLGEPGMWDTVENKFYRNQGTGLFTLGNKITLKEYEYLLNDGNSYINTEYNLNTGDVFKFTYLDVFNNGTKVTGSSENKGYGQGTTGSSAANYSGGGRIYGRTIMMFLNSNNTDTGIASNNSTGIYTETLDIKASVIDIRFESSTGTVYINKTINSATKNTGVMHLYRDSGTLFVYPGVKKIYKVTITKNNQLVRDFIPVSYNGTPGLWDKVEWKFYGNAGSGNFTLGPEKAVQQDAPIFYDSSGYCNHGSITGTLTTNSDSPRYTNSIQFGSNKLISTTASGPYILTMSIWAKDAGSTPTDGLMFKDHLGDMALGIQNGTLYSGKSGGKGAGNKAISAVGYTANTWHHWVMVNRNNTFYVYMDGQQVLSGTSGSWSAGTVANALHIGGRSGSSPWPGKLSDFRAYATALSEDDIKELYNTSAFVTNNGVFAEYELYEDNLSDVKKTGLLETANFYENGAESGYALDTDKTRVASNYIISEDFIEI